MKNQVIIGSNHIGTIGRNKYKIQQRISVKKSSGQCKCSLLDGFCLYVWVLVFVTKKNSLAGAIP